MKSTEDLIKELSHSHTSVSRDYSPFVRSVLFLYLLSALIAAVLYFIRPFTFHIQNISHGMELISLFLFLNALTYFGFKSFVPGERKKASFYAVLISFSLLLLSLIPRYFVGQSYNVIRPNCEFEAMGVSLITTLLGHILLRRNEYALRSTLSKGIFLSMPMTAIVFLHGVCSLELYHVFMCHIAASLFIPSVYLIAINRMRNKI
ncbi:MAG: hypothetical protein K2P81_11745 [Bacteriovoracaceae bacterium]|nr:hypothetical protein [Bacteriovoracaceae bacterium]